MYSLFLRYIKCSVLFLVYDKIITISLFFGGFKGYTFHFLRFLLIIPFSYIFDFVIIMLYVPSHFIYVPLSVPSKYYINVPFFFYKMFQMFHKCSITMEHTLLHHFSFISLSLSLFLLSYF